MSLKYLWHERSIPNPFLSFPNFWKAPWSLTFPLWKQMDANKRVVRYTRDFVLFSPHATSQNTSGKFMYLNHTWFFPTLSRGYNKWSHHLKISRLSQLHSQILGIPSLEHCFPVLLGAFQRIGPHVYTMGSGRILNEGFFFYCFSAPLCFARRQT